MNTPKHPFSTIGDLQLDEALLLLRHAGLDGAVAHGVSDFSALQSVIDSLCELSSRDGLTGLANQRQFRLILDRELDRVARTGEPLTLLLFDIDHFKQVNDTHGHPAGDEALKRVGGILETAVRPMDTVARIGGEEWAVILPSSRHAHACGTADRLRAEIENPPVFLEDGTSLKLTVSCGGAVVAPWSVVSPSALIAEVDRALYAAKRGGRNRVCFAESTDSQVSAEEKAALFDSEGSITS